MAPERVLAVAEDTSACYVVWGADEGDWLVRFDKAGSFAARAWADNMATTYNLRARGLIAATNARAGAARP